MATLLALGVLMLSPLPPPTTPGDPVLMTEDIPTLANGDYGPVLAGRAYAAARHMGAEMLRVHTGRDALFSWEYNVDPFVDGALARGFEPYVSLTYRRRYRHADDPAFLGLPTPAELGAWCGEAAARYAGRVRHYGVFNEPNYFGDGMTPRHYNRLFRACRDAIEAADPAARVYYGEIAADERARTPCRWVERSLAAAGGPTVADGLAIHTYQWTTPPELPADGRCRGIGRLGDWNDLRDGWARATAGPRLTARDGGPVPLLITEHGYCAADGECPPSDDGSGADSRLDDVTRADWARRAYLWARDHGVAVFSWYHLVNQPPGDPLWDSGIVTQEGEPTLTVEALRDAVGATRGR